MYIARSAPAGAHFPDIIWCWRFVVTGTGGDDHQVYCSYFCMA